MCRHRIAARNLILSRRHTLVRAGVSGDAAIVAASGDAAVVAASGDAASGDAVAVAASGGAAVVAASGEAIDFDAVAPEPLAMPRGPVAAPTYTAITTSSTTSYWHFEFPKISLVNA